MKKSILFLCIASGLGLASIGCYKKKYEKVEKNIKHNKIRESIGFYDWAVNTSITNAKYYSKEIYNRYKSNNRWFDGWFNQPDNNRRKRIIFIARDGLPIFSHCNGHYSDYIINDTHNPNHNDSVIAKRIELKWYFWRKYMDSSIRSEINKY